METLPKEKRHAILIGNGYYQDQHNLPPLRMPRQNAATLSHILSDARYAAFPEANVRCLTDIDSGRMNLEIEDFLNRATMDDLLLFYFSGYALAKYNGELYLAAADTEMETQRGLTENTALPLARLRQLFSDCCCQRIVVILDCCRHNSLMEAFIAEQATDLGAYFIVSISDFQSAAERKNADCSIFTRYFLTALQGQDGTAPHSKITLDDIYHYVEREVEREAPAFWIMHRFKDESRQQTLCLAQCPSPPLETEAQEDAEQAEEELSFLYPTLGIVILLILLLAARDIFQRHDFSKTSSPLVPPDMSLIEAGQLQHGERMFEISAFYLDKTEVSNAEYLEFINAGGYQNAAYWNTEAWRWLQENQYTEPHDWNNKNFSQADHPVTGVSWYEADAYCRWRGKSLPTEAQWEFAAGGKDAAEYAFGNNFTDSEANFCDTNCDKDERGDDGFKYTAPVTQYGPKNNGLYNMSGNVLEWVQDWHDGRYFEVRAAKKDPVNTQKTDNRVLRGGSWDSWADSLRVSARVFNHPGFRFSVIGFRCAAPVVSE